MATVCMGPKWPFTRPNSVSNTIWKKRVSNLPMDCAHKEERRRCRQMVRRTDKSQCTWTDASIQQGRALPSLSADYPHVPRQLSSHPSRPALHPAARAAESGGWPPSSRCGPSRTSSEPPANQRPTAGCAGGRPGVLQRIKDKREPQMEEGRWGRGVLVYGG